MKHHRIITLLLSVMMILSVAPVIPINVSALETNVVAADMKSGKTGQCTWVLEGTELTISGSGKMDHYGSETPWGTDITKVTIMDEVTNIGYFAFNTCTKLTSVTIGNSVKTIGDYAFWGCTKLTSIFIPASVEKISGTAFQSYGLKDISVDSNNKTYDSRDNCNAIIETKSDELILGCVNTVIPQTITTISNGAFYNCVGLKNISIPDSVTSINSVAFYNCTNLESVWISKSVNFIDVWAFEKCCNLKAITVAEENSTYDSRNNCNAIIETKTNTLYRGCINTTIPDSIESIGKGAFNSCIGMKTIVLPKSIKFIESYAFGGCSNLTNITFSDTLKNIGNNAFVNCNSLKSVTIPQSVESIGENAFRHCEKLKRVTIIGGETSIGDQAFGYYTENWEEKKYENITFYGVIGSATEKYAVENGYTFIELGTEPQAKPGDADGDGEVTLMDVTEVQHLLSSMNINANEETLMFADVDKNGLLEIIDATFIQRYVAGMETPYAIG